MKNRTSVLIGAALLMATSAVGPGFLTQSAVFTATYLKSLAIVIVCVIAMDMITQYNVWSVVGVSGMRAQDIANKVFPGLGYVLAALVAFGGLVFNIGNVGGISLGLYTLLGIPTKIGCLLGGAFAICIFLSKHAHAGMDKLAQILGCLIVIVTAYVAISTKPPVGDVVLHIFQPEDPGSLILPMITILGGSCGGYISFAGAHRLLDADIKGYENLNQIRKSVLLGTSVSGTVRILMFLATLGICLAGGAAASDTIINADNPAAEVFFMSLGQLGYKMFGLVLLCASMTSVIGAAYTSVSFLKTLSRGIAKYEKYVIIGFIATATAIMAIFGNAAKLLVAAGAVNGLILPVSLAVILAAAHNKSIVGDQYRHNKVLTCLGIFIVVLTAFAGIRSLSNLAQLFA